MAEKRMMQYGGRAVPWAAAMPGFGDVPELDHWDRGVNVGDYALIDGDAVEWDGQRWVPSQWRKRPS